jgi:ElaB/YqjD/DUF883 family membrane-anchored ribosome-binding protein
LRSELSEEIAMRKKKAAPRRSSKPVGGENKARADSDAQAEQSPEVNAAANAVQRAEAELKKAREVYEQVRQKATEQLSQVRQKRVGELIDDTLKLVRKHPGPSVVIAALVGFWLGRLFRR